jgi:hypothetical protein
MPPRGCGDEGGNLNHADVAERVGHVLSWIVWVAEGGMHPSLMLSISVAECAPIWAMNTILTRGKSAVGVPAEASAARPPANGSNIFDRLEEALGPGQPFDRGPEAGQRDWSV